MNFKSRQIAVILFVVTGSFTGIRGQDQRIADSLAGIYREGRLAGTEKMELLKNLAFHEGNDLDLGLSYADELIALALETDNQAYLHSGYLQRGNKNALAGQMEKALEAYFQSVKAASAANSRVGEGIGYMAVGDIYSQKNDSSNASLYYDKAIVILRQNNDPILLATALLNAGEYHIHNAQYNQALAYLEEAGPIFEQEKHASGIAYTLGNMGMVYTGQGDDKAAIINFTGAIALLEKLQDYSPIAEYLIYLSEIQARNQQPAAAIQTAERSLNLANHYGFKLRIQEANLQLARLYEQMGRPAESYAHYKQYIAYRDSVNNLAAIQKMANLRTNFEVDQKQTEVDLLEKESEIQLLKEKRLGNIMVASFIALGFVFLLAMGLYNRNRYIRKTRRLIEQEKERSERLLRNILPEETARELKANGKVLAKKFDSVSVLFTDFELFTMHSEHLSPEELVASVDFYFSKFDAIIEKHKLEKIKTVGDAYMCAGGLPYPSEDHAVRMVQAAIEIAEFVEETKADSNGKHKHFDIRIGINTGPVVAGVVGTTKFAYDIWGDTVNVAARMESNSQPGKINISDNTFALVKDAFDCEYRGQIAVKNKGIMKMYYVNGIKTGSRQDGNLIARNTL